MEYTSFLPGNSGLVILSDTFGSSYLDNIYAGTIYDPNSNNYDPIADSKRKNPVYSKEERERIMLIAKSLNTQHKKS
jgi:hypothetical protein